MGKIKVWYMDYTRFINGRLVPEKKQKEIEVSVLHFDEKGNPVEVKFALKPATAKLRSDLRELTRQSDERSKAITDEYTPKKPDLSDIPEALQAGVQAAAETEAAEQAENTAARIAEMNIKLRDEEDHYHLEFFKTCILVKSITPEAVRALWEEDVRTSEFWQQQDMNEIEEFVLCFRSANGV